MDFSHKALNFGLSIQLLPKFGVHSSASTTGIAFVPGAPSAGLRAAAMPGRPAGAGLTGHRAAPPASDFLVDKATVDCQIQCQHYDWLLHAKYPQTSYYDLILL